MQHSAGPVLGVGIARIDLNPTLLAYSAELVSRRPMALVSTRLTAPSRSPHRMPRHMDWVRCTFEQGALSLLPKLSAVMPAVVLPGPRLFQANRVDP